MTCPTPLTDVSQLSFLIDKTWAPSPLMGWTQRQIWCMAVTSGTLWVHHYLLKPCWFIPCWFIHTSRFQTRPNWEGLKILHHALWINISVKFKTLKYSNDLFSLYYKPLGLFTLPTYWRDEFFCQDQVSKNERHTCVIWSSYHSFSRTSHVTPDCELA